MILQLFLLTLFYIFMTLFAYAGCHTTLGWSKPKAILGGIFWFITGFIYLGIKLVKAMEKDKCKKQEKK